MFGLRYYGLTGTAPSFVVTSAKWRDFWCPNTTAFTLWGNFVVYRSPSAAANVHVREHELTHVRQCRRTGWALFILKYAYYTAKHGYRNNPYEIEARQAASRLRRQQLRHLEQRGVSVRYKKKRRT